MYCVIQNFLMMQKVTANVTLERILLSQVTAFDSILFVKHNTIFSYLIQLCWWHQIKTNSSLTLFYVRYKSNFLVYYSHLPLCYIYLFVIWFCKVTNGVSKISITSSCRIKTPSKTSNRTNRVKIVGAYTSNLRRAAFILVGSKGRFVFVTKERLEVMKEVALE